MVTIDDIHFGLPSVEPQDWGKVGDRTQVGHKISAPLWLKTDIVDGLPTRWPRAMAVIYVPQAEEGKRDEQYLNAIGTIRERSVLDLNDDDLQALFIDNVNKEPESA